MQTRLSRERQQRFLATLADAGDVATAAAAAGTTRTRLDEIRRGDPEFATEWEKAERVWADKLEQEARRRAIEGVREPLISDGKILRDDDGQPIVVRRYSDELLLAFLKSHRPQKFNDYTMIEVAIYPRWLRYLFAVFMLAFAVWVIGDLTIQATQDHVLVAIAPR